MPRALTALSDQSGLLTSYGVTISAILRGSLADMQPVALSFSIGCVISSGGLHGPLRPYPPTPAEPDEPALVPPVDEPAKLPVVGAPPDGAPPVTDAPRPGAPAAE